jgi:hypothetical protein
MWFWRRWVWLFRRKPQELLPPGTSSTEVQESLPPPVIPGLLPYAIAGESSSAASMAAPSATANADIAIQPQAAILLPVKETEPVSPIPLPASVESVSPNNPDIAIQPEAPILLPVKEAEPVSPIPLPASIESVSPEAQPPLPAVVAPANLERYTESWIRDRAGYFSFGGYGQPSPEAKSVLAPDLLFRLGIDIHRAPPEAGAALSTDAVPLLAAPPIMRLMDDFTTTSASAPSVPDPQGRVLSVDPLLLTLFFSAREGGLAVPAEATSEYLTETLLLANGIKLRDQVLQHWASGGSPVSTQQLYDLALRLCPHPGTAMLQCHNVTKAFARGGDAIRWQVINRARGEYSDGRLTFSVTGLRAVPGASIFPALFATSEPGMSDAGGWYRYFACATAACYAGTSQTRIPVAAPSPETEQAVRRVVDAGQILRSSAFALTPAYRGWLWVNSWIFVETAIYSRNQQAAHGEALTGMRGASFGLSAAGCVLQPEWRWGVPKAAAAVGSTLDSIAEWLGPNVRERGGL